MIAYLLELLQACDGELGIELTTFGKKRDSVLTQVDATGIVVVEDELTKVFPWSSVSSLNVRLG